MASTFRFHLIDEHGHPVGDHIANAIASLERKIIRQFGPSCDPAVLSDKIEALARNTARYEEKHGPVDDIKSFILKSVRNLVASQVRATPSVMAVDFETLERWAGPARDAGPEQIHNLVLARETLESMPERDQQICRLWSQGVSAREIGSALGMSAENVWTTIHRVRKATQKALSDNRIRSAE